MIERLRMSRDLATYIKGKETDEKKNPTRSISLWKDPGEKMGFGDSRNRRTRGCLTARALGATRQRNEG